MDDLAGSRRRQDAAANEKGGKAYEAEDEDVGKDKTRKAAQGDPALASVARTATARS
jgi:hypothetical protein